jgi:hypothetical protein
MDSPINLGKYVDQMVEVVLQDGSSYVDYMRKKDSSYSGEFPYLFGGYSYTEDGRYEDHSDEHDIACVYVLGRSASPLKGIAQFSPYIDLSVFNEGDEVYIETFSGSRKIGVIGEFTENRRRKIRLSNNVQAYCRLDGNDGLDSRIMAIYGPGAFRLDLVQAPDPAVVSALNTLSLLSPDQLSKVLNHFNQQ